MKIIALDSSGLVASVAIVEDDTLIGEYNIQYKKTHSQTLLPMLDELSKMVELDLKSVDAIAQADAIRREQNQIIQETVKINEDIAERIHQENNEFSNIADMVHGNTQEIMVLSEQVDNLDNMIKELEKLLEE